MSKKRDEPPVGPAKQVCETCQFWDTQEVCHFFPPTPLYRDARDGGIGRVQNIWPATKADDWCGQWAEQT